MNIHNKDNLLIGIISDTHGLLRPEAVDAMRGADLIIHAGDIGKENILDELGAIAPVVAVRGNTDRESWACKLRSMETLKLNKTLIYVIHDINQLGRDTLLSHVNVIINGHTHRPSVNRHNGVLYVNPGSAGPKRLNLPVSMALLRLKGGAADAGIVQLGLSSRLQGPG
ncbi:MAG: metallophosphoesterase [Nitrospiraceae bacterium]|nr:MAG: metallophosphoesterase [Nitrospiraceae bacterium]